MTLDTSRISSSAFRERRLRLRLDHRQLSDSRYSVRSEMRSWIASPQVKLLTSPIPFAAARHEELDRVSWIVSLFQGDCHFCTMPICSVRTLGHGSILSQSMSSFTMKHLSRSHSATQSRCCYISHPRTDSPAQSPSETERHACTFFTDYRSGLVLIGRVRET
jgi:hypothetical protein